LETLLNGHSVLIFCPIKALVVEFRNFGFRSPELAKPGDSAEWPLCPDLLPYKGLGSRSLEIFVSDHLSWLSLETLLNGHSVLIFCPIKAWVESLAENLAKNFYSLGRPDPLDTDPVSCAVRYYGGFY
jgi:hypothetical protein